MAHVTRKRIADITRQMGGYKTFDEVEQDLIGRGHDVEPPPNARGTRSFRPQAVPRPEMSLGDIYGKIPGVGLGAHAIDNMPGLLGGGLSMLGTVLAGNAGRYAGGVLGSTTGRAIQEGAYNTVGLAPPKQDFITNMMAESIPGFKGIPGPLQSGASSLGLDAVGHGLEKGVRLGSKMLGELAVGHPNLRYAPAETAVDEGIAFSRRGQKKIVRLLGELTPDVNKILDNSPLNQFRGKQLTGYKALDPDQAIVFGKDEIPEGPGVWFERDVLLPSLDRVLDIIKKSKNTNAEVAMRQIYRKMISDPRNQGTLGARRIHQLSLPGPGVAAVKRGRNSGRSPAAGELSYWKQVADEQVSDQARRILSDAHPDAKLILERESRLMHLGGKIAGHIEQPGRTLFVQQAAGAGAGILASQLLPHESKWDRARNTLLGGGAGWMLGNPDVALVLSKMMRQVPRAASSALPDDLSR